MANSTNAFDVFIAYDHRDKDVAAKVAAVLRSYDLEVFLDAQQLQVGERLEDAIWEAMAESQALVVIIREDAPTSWLAFELGAARAWNKPVYAVTATPTLVHPQHAMQDIQVLPLSRVEEIAKLIKDSREPMTDEDLQHLGQSYRRIEVPVDQLAFHPQHLASLVKEFNKRTGKKLSGEQVMRLLLRQRKRGSLPAIAKRRAV